MASHRHRDKRVRETVGLLGPTPRWSTIRANGCVVGRHFEQGWNHGLGLAKQRDESKRRIQDGGDPCNDGVRLADVGDLVGDDELELVIVEQLNGAAGDDDVPVLAASGETVGRRPRVGYDEGSTLAVVGGNQSQVRAMHFTVALVATSAGRERDGCANDRQATESSADQSERKRGAGCALAEHHRATREQFIETCCDGRRQKPKRREGHRKHHT